MKGGVSSLEPPTRFSEKYALYFSFELVTDGLQVRCFWLFRVATTS